MTTTTRPTCPKCNCFMVEREAKKTGRKFWGCAGFPKCKGILNFTYIKEEVKEDIKDFSGFDASPQQKRIKDTFFANENNLFISALAGSGKSTTILWLSSLLSEKCLITAFNKKIADELKSKTRHNVTTLHSLGLDIIKAHLGQVKISKWKTANLLQKMCADKETYDLVVSGVSKLVSAYKNTYVDLDITDEKLLFLLEQYSHIKINTALQNEIFSYVKQVLIAEDNKTIDFDDMIFLPACFGWELSQDYQIIFVDEAQDLNYPQFVLLESLAGNNTRFVFVGDENQSINAFRGAMSDSVQKIVNHFNCEILPLNLTYRNSQAVTRLVNDEFPEIEHNCLKNAPEGSVQQIHDLYDHVLSGDMVLCRTNSPMIEEVFTLQSRGIKAYILGRDLANELVGQLSRYEIQDMTALVEILEQEKADRVAELLLKGKKQEAIYKQDFFDCLIGIGRKARNINHMVEIIDKMFEPCENCVTFSTIHKSKGLENERVFIIRPDLLPHPQATTDEEKEQEANLKYVAYTRAKLDLFLVSP